MFCHQCGFKLPDNSKFCMQCGAKLDVGYVSDTSSQNQMENEDTIQYSKELIDENKVKLLMEADDNDFYHSMLNVKDNYYYVPSPLGTFKISHKMVEVVEIVVSINKIMASTIKDFCEYYESYGIAMLYREKSGGKYEIVEGLVTKVGELAVKFLQKNRLYSYDIENVMNTGDPYSPLSPLNILNDNFERIRIKLDKIGRSIDALKQQNEVEHSNHMRLSGGGFGLKGALVGIAKAEAVNFVIDMVYDSKKNSMEKKIDQYGTNSLDSVIRDPDTLNTLLSGIIKAINEIKMYTLECIKLNELYNENNIKEASAIINNIKQGFIGDDDIKDAYIEAFIKDPFQIEIYKECYKTFRDENCYLTVFSRFFFMDNEIKYLKYQDIISGIMKNDNISMKNDLLNIYQNNQYDDFEEVIKIYTRDQAELINVINDKKEVDYLYKKINMKGDGVIYGMTCLIDALTSLKSNGDKSIRAFQYMNSDMEEIKIPARTKEIGSFAFVNCKKLKNIILPEPLVRIGMGAFYGCDKLIEKAGLGDEDIVIPDSVTYIGDIAFKKGEIDDEKDTRNVRFKGGLCDTLYLTAFSFDKVYLPEETNNILIGAGRVESEFVFSGDSKYYDFFEKNNLMEKTRILTKESLAYHFINTSYFEKSTISQYEALGRRVFENLSDSNILSKLEDIEIKQICYRAFYNSSLTKAKLKVEKIQKEAFLNCQLLEEVECEDGLKYIGDKAFYGCANMEKIKLPSSVIFIGDDFVDKNTMIECPTDSYVYEYCMKNGYKLKIDEGEHYYNEALKHRGNRKKYYELLIEANKNNNIKACIALIDYYLERKQSSAISECCKYLHKFIGSEYDINVIAKLGKSLFNEKECMPYDNHKLQGLYLLTKAAKNNDADAMLYLSEYYSEINDAKKAYVCASLAKKNGNSKADKILSNLGIGDEDIAQDEYENIFNNNIPSSNYDLVMTSAIMNKKNKNGHSFGLTHYVDGLYLATGDDKSKNKIKKATAAYCNKMDKDEYPICCYDYTFWGSANEGFVITTKKIYSKYEKYITELSISDIDAFALYVDNKTNDLFIRFYCSKNGKEWCDDNTIKRIDFFENIDSDFGWHSVHQILDQLEALLNILKWNIPKDYSAWRAELTSIGIAVEERRYENVDRKKILSVCKNRLFLKDSPKWCRALCGCYPITGRRSSRLP